MILDPYLFNNFKSTIGYFKAESHGFWWILTFDWHLAMIYNLYH